MDRPPSPSRVVGDRPAPAGESEHATVRFIIETEFHNPELGRELTSEEIAADLRDLITSSGDGHEYTNTTVTPEIEPERVELVLNPTDDDTGNAAWTCPGCGSQAFTYNENVGSTRCMNENNRDGIEFGDTTLYDGDDDPGATCDGCGTLVTLPEACELSWS